MLDHIDLKQALAQEEYRKVLRPLQRRLHSLQRQYWNHDLSALIVFEGWDASGKGSSIRKLTERLEPRGFTLHRIRERRSYEREMPWLWRFWNKLPAYGSMGIFDRSWYGRVLVQRVEDTADETEWPVVFQEISDFERTLADDRYVLMKFFLHIDREEQRARFEALESDPLTAWEVEPEDWARHERYDEYLSVTEEMLERTESEWAPWTIVPATDRYHTRIHVLRTVGAHLEHGLRARGIEPDSDPVIDDDEDLPEEER